VTSLGIGDLEVAGKRVLVRADLNVPLRDGVVVDDFRLLASLPTIDALRKRGATVIVASHLGRPDGPDPAFSLAPVAERLGELGGFPVVFAGAVVGPVAAAAVEGAGDAVVVLENTRFEPGETRNAPELADALAELADLFVLDAFGSAHRAHASTSGVAERLRSAAGLLVAAETAALQRLLDATVRPYVVVLGGAKVSDKLGVIRALLPKVDAMLIGGGMCFTLLAADGYEVGRSLVDHDRMDEVGEVLRNEGGSKILLPTDVVVADSFAADAANEVQLTVDIPEDGFGLDIGPETRASYAAVIGNSEQLFWNGPMGVFEWEVFRAGTAAVADAVATAPGFTVVGGGDTITAIRQLGLEGSVDHLSTGGGAGLELLESGSLPALETLRRWSDGA
jgi:phosphoglycerate kinase